MTVLDAKALETDPNGLTKLRLVLESDPPRRLSYSWHSIYDEDMEKEKPSRVTFVLEPDGNSVKLTVTHEDFAEGSKVLPDISGGWPLVLSSLKSILETGQPLDFDIAK